MTYHQRWGILRQCAGGRLPTTAVTQLTHVSFLTNTFDINVLANYMLIENLLNEWTSVVQSCNDDEHPFMKHLHECLLSLVDGVTPRGRCRLWYFKYELHGDSSLRKYLIDNVPSLLLGPMADTTTGGAASAALEALVLQCVRVEFRLKR